MSTCCTNAAGQPYASVKPDTYLKAQLDKITKPAENRAAAAQTPPDSAAGKDAPLNASGPGQLLNTTA